MLNMETLDKVIALVVVLLALSLFIQSLQNLIKKLFKIKSLQIEQSLVHLFTYVLEKNVLDEDAGGNPLQSIKKWANSLIDNSPVVRMVVPGTSHPSGFDPQVDALFKGVAREFKKIGRVTQTGRLMMDSISRDDLLKFMNRMPVAGLITQMFANIAPNELDSFGKTVAGYKALITGLKSQYQNVVQEPAFVNLEQTLAPILEDLGNFLSGASDSEKLLVDITNLRQLDPKQVTQLMADVPQQLDAIKKFINDDSSPNAGDKKGALETLEKMEATADKVSESLGEIMRAFTTVQGLKSRVETWYDTVMQSFEERYTRGMKTWTIVISAVVVIVFNINVLNVYREISTSSAKRALILQSADRVLAQSKAANDGNGSTKTQTPPKESTDANVTPEQVIEDAKKVFSQQNIDYMTDIGLKGPKWITGIPEFFKPGGYSAQKTQADPYYRPKLVIKTLFGWGLMTLLLSAGAPFWEDTLETLFGLKNRMRKQTETRNVETQSGAGQTKS